MLSVVILIVITLNVVILRVASMLSGVILIVVILNVANLAIAIIVTLC
jgi:hypothetical protein